MDFARLNESLLYNAVNLLETWLPNGKLRNGEYKLGSLNGESGKSLSINTKTGRWCDFATKEKGGDLISLYAAIKSISNGKAYEELGGEGPGGETKNTTVIVASRPKTKPLKFELEPLPDDIKLPNINAEVIYEYRNQDGKLYCLEARTKDKNFIPYTHVNGKWISKAPIGLRPLYGLEFLGKTKHDKIIITEGCKSCNAARELLPSFQNITWMGGANAVKRTDWSPIGNTRVLIWPDADEPGLTAAHEIKNLLSNAMILNIEINNGWDAANALEEGWTTQQTTEFIKKNCHDTSTDLGDSQQNSPLIPTRVVESHRLISDYLIDNKHFSCLGYNKEHGYFLNKKRSQIAERKLTDITSLFLYTLADRHFWDSMYLDLKNKGEKVMQAQSDIIRAVEKKGLFDSAKVRGRGAWVDDGRLVVHLGEQLIVNGQQTALHDIESEFIYEKKKPITIKFGTPLQPHDAKQLIKICNGFGWEKNTYPLLLAGWIFTAPICATLPWRSHIYITGPAGSGKSWVMREVIERTLGNIPIKLQGNTTEAGARQTIDNDGRPIIFDEAEASDRASKERMQMIFNLARQASTEDGAPIVKGDQAQKEPKQYFIRSSFAFSSIHITMSEYQDKTRTTIFRLVSPDKSKEEQERFKEHSKFVTSVLTDEFVASFLARSIKMIPIVRKNQEIFARVGAEIFGSRRIADQMASMIAGYHGLILDTIVTDAQAAEWLNKYDWTEEEQLSQENSETTLLNFLLSREIKINSMSGHIYNRTIAEMVHLICGLDHPDKISITEADMELKRKGIIIDCKKKTITFANRSQWFERVLKDSEWSYPCNEILSRLDGAYKSRKPRKFAGTASHYIRIPFNTLLEETNDN